MSIWLHAIATADRQGGAIARTQLCSIGLSSSAIGRRIASHQLFERHPGVYALGRRGLSPYGEAWAAVLATRGRGALDGWSALALMQAAPWPHVPEIVVTGGLPDLERVDVRRTRRLPGGDTWHDRNGLRACTWPRAVVNLAGRSPVAGIQDALDAVERRRMLEVRRLEDAIAGSRGRPACAACAPPPSPT